MSKKWTMKLNAKPMFQAKQNLYEHKHMFNRCSTSAFAHAYAVAGPLARALWNLKHSNTFSKDAPQAQNFAHLCAVYPSNHGLCWPYKSLPLKVSFLEIFNWIFLFILIGSRRDPGLASEKVLASNQFYAIKHFMIICTALFLSSELSHFQVRLLNT